MLKEFIGITSPKTKSLKLLYSLIRKLGPVRINTLSELTGYKHSTCARLLDELVQEGLIYDSGIGESSGGRKPLMYVIHPHKNYVIGVELTSLYTTILLLNLNLEIVGIEKLKMSSECTGEYTLDYITSCIDSLLAKHQIAKEQLLGIGIGVIDPIDREQGTFKNPHLFTAGGWENLNIIEYLQKKNEILVLLDNGINLAALAEYRKNHWKETDNLTFVSNDLGIRYGAIFQGRMVSYKNDIDDAFGHMTVDIHGRRCTCGSFGCLQAYSSIPAIRDEVVRKIKRGKYSILQERVTDSGEIDFHHILEAIEEKDPLCLEVVQDAAYYYGVGLSNLILLLRPDVVICGGALIPKPLFFDVVSQTAQKRLRHNTQIQTRIIKSTTAYEIVAQGAGCMILDYFTEEY
ncbi:ROK family protein [Neobacillus sp. LXY-1]|uniref:ROK family protein n=1 Tax=Neobacillus sp. LXY-1 TaxID=3379133 RepID=UPI003EE06B81